jgi:hypothetical protein
MIKQMKAEELRIGNWVKGDIGKPYQFELGDFHDWWADHNSHTFGDHIHPTPLTEEWLLKFGFDKEGNRPKWVDDLASYNIGNENIQYVKMDSWKCIKIRYVHQLQNLYFALTGNELTLSK